ncbi:undecaprenyl-phosphate galactose phosphotransferase WbaP [Deinococcus sp. KSM4-11]|uniref:undecaprenyl-phosphate galactose phosphotransferase WbaP n=1 Tax=Deinococcus sp. KSM4-11 TaxID=2568654 RepID=UPI0010A2EBDA|nr:undecaprenyl-phosphate galactose phosphotransferase WbaP [Deinococcus sp. KSM4-11]THF87265.1 undecaprenyl-phosphate galactose phosphotransferase WbaP [Deinococcus sp. KSM4-11]
MSVLSPTQQGRHAAEEQRTRFQSALPQAAALIAGDILSLAIAFILAAALHGRLNAPVSPLALAVWGGLWLIWRAYQGLYPGYGRAPQTELRLHVIGTVQLVGVQLASALAIQRFFDGASGTLVAWILLLLIAMPMRYAVRAILIRAGRYGRRISVIGAGQTAAIAISHLRNHRSYGLIPVAAYDDNPALHGQIIHGVPVLGSIDLALTEPKTEQALISIPGARAETQQRLVNSVYAVFPYTWVVPDLFGVPNQALHPHSIGSVASLEIRNNLGSYQARALKRMIDLLGATVAAVLLLPLLIVIAGVIRLDSPGPVVYRARRLGRHGQPFDCFKFRSMHNDADEILESMLSSSPALRDEFESSHKLKDDPRVTRVGALLRKTSLDELPQLANVLLGSMSLVGPRPIVEAETIRYGEIYATYKQVRPGMTGYWQANGRSDTTYSERVGMDNFYITNWSPWLDTIILIQTVRVVLLGKGAY